ncbi:MAG TPA: AMP-binding protein, partial [Actinomycetota bacterium]|nr:AMP-binding protein [Actinomycetota bacterium]
MIFRSPLPEVSYPSVPFTDLIFEKAHGLGDKPALIDGPSGRTITYAQLTQGINAVAAGLHAREFGKGDVFAIYLPNLPEYAVVYHAVARLGGASTTVNPLYTAEELAFQLNDAGAKFLLTIPQFMEAALEAAGQSPVKEVFVLGEAEGATPLQDLMLPGGEVPEVTIEPDDVIALPYSSGTTGLPKGVEITHSNLVANMHQTDAVLPLGEDDTVIAVLPFFHIYGQQVIMNCGLGRGGTTVTLPKFDFEQFLKAIQDYKVTRAYLVPPIMLALAKHPLVEQFDLSSLKMITSGAAPLGQELQEAVGQRLGCKVIQGYGLTETSPVTHTALHWEEPKFGSIGPLIPNTEGKVVDVDTGDDLGVNEEGEICVRGPQIMKGYLNNTEATAQT